MPDPVRVLALHAHPGNLEFQYAGTLALLRQAGCHVAMATMTPGDCGSAEHGPEAIAAIRRDEAQAAPELIGAEYLCLEFRDLAIFDDDESRRRVAEEIRRACPGLALTAPPANYLCDHERTSDLVRDACFCAPAPNYATRLWDPAPPLARISHLYFVDPREGRGHDGRIVAPDFHVDITAVFSINRTMPAWHASRRDWLRRQHGMDGVPRQHGARRRGAGARKEPRNNKLSNYLRGRMV